MPIAVKSYVSQMLLWMAGCSLVVLSGCSQPTADDPLQVVQVRGKVLYKGQPLAGAQLTFHRETGGESAFAVTDGHGQFTGMTNDTSGMFPGSYQVTVTHPRITLPQKFADVESSPLELVLFDDESEKEFPVDLND